MRLSVLFSLALALVGACAPAPRYGLMEPGKALPLEGLEGAVVAGIATENDGLSGGLQERLTFFPIGAGFGFGAGLGSPISTLVSCGGVFHPCQPGVRYVLMRLPPGTYALGAVSRFNEMYPLIHFSSISTVGSASMGQVNFPSAGQISKDTPLFRVRGGEVSYIGTFVLTPSGDGPKVEAMTLNRASNEQEARQFLAKTGLADRMVAQPWVTNDPHLPKLYYANGGR
ncbi:hypothetical protein [Nitrospirillum iridis]|uniref:Lipoprotein n=1 Tax=Nitrospirillum iridis TaxID=765888 RepID=A0A7X0ECY7_9PROT|nr:hypothetical protein [Nitrospirillum iridis]MBB6251565.1 hypothetical protein [Nitrospirillum iridis]